jgi:hypothetical protein
MKGEGNIAEMLGKQFKMHTNKLGLNKETFAFNYELFSRPQAQLRLF